jgi:MFS family permease
MASKLRAFVVWAVLPYLSLVVLELVVRGSRANPGTTLRSLTSSVGLFIFFSCLAQAMLGTTILWLLPIKRVWAGILLGIVVAVVATAISTWLELSFFGGFEANIGIWISVMILSLPTFFAAGYAGLLRARG